MITVKVGDYEYAVQIDNKDRVIYSPLKAFGNFVGVSKYEWKEPTPRQSESLTGLYYPASMDYLRECVYDGVSIVRDLERI